MERIQKKASADELRRKGPLTGLALGVFGPQHPIRVGIAYVSRHRWFENIMLLCIGELGFRIGNNNIAPPPHSTTSLDTVRVPYAHIALHSHPLA